MEAFLISVGVIAFLVLIGGIKVLREYERGVIFRLGRLVGARGPGIFYVWPIIEQMVKVELRIVTLDIPRQEVITRDNVTISVNAVLYFRVYNPEDAIVQIQDFLRATSQIAQTTMRAVVGQSELDEMLAERDKINNTLQEIIDAHTDPWGIKVTAVEIKDVELPDEMRRAIARQAEAERERRAKIIAAEGEFQASQRLSDAADIIGAHPPALQLRYLQTVVEISAEKASTVVFPLPLEMFEAVGRLTEAFLPQAGSGAEQTPPAPEPPPSLG